MDQLLCWFLVSFLMYVGADQGDSDASSELQYGEKTSTKAPLPNMLQGR